MDNPTPARRFTFGSISRGIGAEMRVTRLMCGRGDCTATREVGHAS